MSKIGDFILGGVAVVVLTIAALGVGLLAYQWNYRRQHHCFETMVSYSSWGIVCDGNVVHSVR